MDLVYGFNFYGRPYRPFINVHKSLLKAPIKLMDLAICKIRHNKYFEHPRLAVILKITKNRRHMLMDVHKLINVHKRLLWTFIKGFCGRP